MKKDEFLVYANSPKWGRLYLHPNGTDAEGNQKYVFNASKDGAAVFFRGNAKKMMRNLMTGKSFRLKLEKV